MTGSPGAADGHGAPGGRPAPTVRPMVPADLPAASVCAARAFFDDPVLGWFQSDLERQQRQFPAAMRVVIEDCLTAGRAWVAVDDGRIRGVAAWLAPGGYPRTPRRDLRVAARALVAFLPPDRRSLTGLRLILAIERAHPHDEHWYLALLAVDPLVQRRGLGTALVDPGLASADAEGLPAYLETQRPENLPFYARFGFEQVGQLRMGTSPPVWALRRPPR